jgi:hypothetical protein
MLVCTFALSQTANLNQHSSGSVIPLLTNGCIRWFETSEIVMAHRGTIDEGADDIS